MLPTSLQIAGQRQLAREPGITMSPYRRSTLEGVLGGLQTWLTTMEGIKQQRKQKAIIDEILGKPEMPAETSKRPQSKLGRILEAFTPMGEPAGITPMEVKIAEAAIRSRYPTALSSTEQYRRNLQRAKQGEVSWDDLKAAYPDKENQIEGIRESTLPKLRKSPKFKFGTGGLISQAKSLVSPYRAEITPETMKIIDQIENIEDLKEIIEREDEARAKGVDVNAILEYFGMTRDKLENYRPASYAPSYYQQTPMPGR